MRNFMEATDIHNRSHRGTQFRIWATQATIRKFRMVRAAVVNGSAPFSQHGGLGKVHQLFGEELSTIIEELNETLAA